MGPCLPEKGGQICMLSYFLTGYFIRERQAKFIKL